VLEGRHFRRDWSGAHDVGRKAAAQNFADIAAMGAVPTALLVSLVLPARLPVKWVLELSDGLAAECALVGATVAGGDMVRGDLVTVSVTALGDLQGREPVRRSGARPGDVVAVAGRLGWSAAGLALLEHGRAADPSATARVFGADGGAHTHLVEDFLDAHRRPQPPYDAGPEAARLGATAMLDVSDGLLADLGHIAEDSGVVVDVAASALDRAGGALTLEWVLTGGEDHALAATFPRGAALPERWRVIGEVRAGTPGVLVDGAAWQGAAGFTHFGGA
jgi:thiamine-monophosphate kinase